MPSTRRSLLAGIGSALASSTAGCVGNFGSPPSGPFEGTVSAVSKYYPAETSTTQMLTALPTNPENSSTEKQSLDDLSTKAHREALIAITRQHYFGTKENQLHIDGSHLIEYGTEFFSVTTSVGGSESAVEYEDILTLDATVEDNKLSITVKNKSSESTTVVTWGTPPFSILFAWNGEPYFLQHEQYNQNNSIVTDNDKLYPSYNGIDIRGKKRTEVAVGGSIEATYTVPNEITNGAKIYLDMLYNIPDTDHVVWEVTLTD
jgi:hypothetical protein